jgi:hypothetical protein
MHNFETQQNLIRHRGFSTDKSKHPYVNNMFYTFGCGDWKLDFSSL